MLSGCIAVLVLTAQIATDIGQTKALKIALLSLFFAGYLLIDIVYLCAFLLRRRQFDQFDQFDQLTVIHSVIHYRFLWNIGLCCITWLGTLASLLLYLTSTIDFITSLLVSSETNHHLNTVSNKINR